MPQIFDSIDFAGDTDRFNVELLRGRRYFIELEGSATGAGTLADPIVRLYDLGTVIRSDDDGGVGRNARISFVPEFTDTYEIEASAFAGGTGSYRLGVFEDGQRNSVEGAGPAGAVHPGGTASARIDYAGDSDVFATRFIEGLTYVLRATGGSLADPVLSLLGANGALIARNDDFSGRDSRIVHQPGETGLHFLRAEGFGTGTGSYTVSVSAGLGTPGDDSLVGTFGRDVIDARGGDDIVNGLAGDDVLRGGTGSDWLTGGTGRDRLFGDAGADLLRGTAGPDILVGGQGRDTLIGGTGPDVFRFLALSDSRPGAADVIRPGDGAPAFQFPAEDGTGAWDRIDLRAIDAVAATAGDDAFTFGTLRGPGRLWTVESGANTVIRGNVDPDPFPEFQLVIADGATRATDYVAADFFL
jgi:hypothetical protein